MSRTRGTRMFSLIRVCGTGRTGSTNRLGLKELSPSRELLPQIMTRPLQGRNGLRPSSFDSVEPPRSARSGGEETMPLLLAESKPSKILEQVGQTERRL